MTLKHLKRAVSRDFRPFFVPKKFTWAPYEQAKTVSNFFYFCEESLKTYVWAFVDSDTDRKLHVRVVVDYSYTC